MILSTECQGHKLTHPYMIYFALIASPAMPIEAACNEPLSSRLTRSRDLLRTMPLLPRFLGLDPILLRRNKYRVSGFVAESGRSYSRLVGLPRYIAELQPANFLY